MHIPARANAPTAMRKAPSALAVVPLRATTPRSLPSAIAPRTRERCATSREGLGVIKFGGERPDSPPAAHKNFSDNSTSETGDRPPRSPRRARSRGRYEAMGELFARKRAKPGKKRNDHQLESNAVPFAGSFGELQINSRPFRESLAPRERRNRMGRGHDHQPARFRRSPSLAVPSMMKVGPPTNVFLAGRHALREATR